MTNSKSTLFSDLEDLDFWADKGSLVAPAVESTQDKELKQGFGASKSKATNAIYEEKCSARGCNGGTFTSWAGRSIGPCFKCNGTGIRKFKTSPETRAKAKTSAVTRKAKEAAAKVAAADKYREDNAALCTYLEEVSGWNGFAASLLTAISKYSSLTEAQFVSATKMHAKHIAKQAAAAEPPKGGTVDLTDLPAGYYAVPDGDTRLKIAIRKPGKNSDWHGSIFVDDGAEYGNRQNYGRQMPGSKQYSGKIVEQLQAIVADPLEAMKAYGRLVGVCGACGRKLEDAKSIELGIGPICLKKF